MGSRFGGGLPKQFQSLDVEFHNSPPGRPLFARTLDAILPEISIDVVVLAVPREYRDSEELQAPLAALKEGASSGPNPPPSRWILTEGGENRHASFQRGAQALFSAAGPNYNILVHDANRPFLRPPFLARVNTALAKLCPQTPAFIPVVPIADSLVRVERGQVMEYMQRDELKGVQTPQLLHGPTLHEILGQKAGQTGEQTGDQGGAAYTDEGSFFSAQGFRVVVFDGDASNRKITYPEDAAT